ncbi:MAG: hypothetical protein ABSA40_01075 [Candidatus Dormibacteria bacterium]
MDAATLACNGAIVAAGVIPGDSGSCSLSFTETAAQLGNPFTVTLDVGTVSTAGGGSAGSGTATEALLDGQATGLQVSITDSGGDTFGSGAPSCSGAYPDAASCSSSDNGQAVPGATAVSAWTDTFTVAWALPLAAGNPYQGGTATITVTPFYNGTPASSPSPSPTGSVAAISSSPTPTGGVLGITTPDTGAGPTSPTSLVLIVVGMALLLLGLCGAGWSVRSGARVP